MNLVFSQMTIKTNDLSMHSVQTSPLCLSKTVFEWFWGKHLLRYAFNKIISRKELIIMPVCCGRATNDQFWSLCFHLFPQSWPAFEGNIMCSFEATSSSRPNWGKMEIPQYSSARVVGRAGCLLWTWIIQLKKGRKMLSNFTFLGPLI